VIQDYSSQQTFNLLEAIQTPVNVIWDVCAGSGGKTIMAADWFPSSRIYASDIREDILNELHRRVKVAGIRKINSFCTNLEHPMSSAVARSNLPSGGADLIIADVPCSGSGTWSRSPERLLQMDSKVIHEYQERQKSIVQRLPQHLKKGGFLLYITCSVYREENSAVVDYILQNSALRLIETEMITGYEKGGDNLFSALFTLPV
jgi:16S rRNA (cytosine967-C5)-methyltransferase